MAGLIQIDVDAGGVVRSLMAIQSRARHLSMAVVAEELLGAVDDVFQAEGAVPGGMKWDPLKASTIRRHPRRAGRPILQATGRTANFQPKTFPLGAEVRSPSQSAGFHVTGTSRMARRDMTAIDFPGTLDNIGFRILEDLGR